MNKETQNKLIKYGVLILAIVFFFIAYKCTQEEPIKVEVKKDGVQELIDKKQVNADSLINESLKKDRLLKDARDSVKLFEKRSKKKAQIIIQQAPDTCNEYIEQLVDIWNGIDSAKTNLIEVQQSKLNDLENALPELQDVIILTKYQLQQSRDSTKAKEKRIVQLTDTIPKVKRKGFIKGFVIGFGSGAAAKEGADILTKIKP